MQIIGNQAPEFLLEGVLNGEIKSVNSLQFYGKYVLYFFYPNDFSRISSSEILSLDLNFEEFKKRGVTVLAVSPDSVYAHLEWISAKKEQDGIGNVRVILLSDMKKIMAREFGVLNEDLGVPYRASFIVNRRGHIVYGAVHNFYTERNTTELLRLIDSFLFSEKNSSHCPIDWQPGDETIPNTHAGSHEYYHRKFGC